MNRSNVNNNSILFIGSNQKNKSLLSSSELKINDCTIQSPLNFVSDDVCNDVLNNVEIFSETTLTAKTSTPTTALSISSTNKKCKRKNNSKSFEKTTFVNTNSTESTLPAEISTHETALSLSESRTRKRRIAESKYYQSHKENILKKRKLYYEDNKDKIII